LSLAVWLLSVCHVVLVVSDWETVDPALLQLLQTARMLQHRFAHHAEGGSVKDGAWLRGSKSPQTPHTAVLRFVLNKCDPKSDVLSPAHTAELCRGLDALFAETSDPASWDGGAAADAEGSPAQQQQQQQQQDGDGDDSWQPASRGWVRAVSAVPFGKPAAYGESAEIDNEFSSSDIGPCATYGRAIQRWRDELLNGLPHLARGFAEPVPPPPSPPAAAAPAASASSSSSSSSSSSGGGVGGGAGTSSPPTSGAAGQKLPSPNLKAKAKATTGGGGGAGQGGSSTAKKKAGPPLAAGQGQQANVKLISEKEWLRRAVRTWTTVTELVAQTGIITAGGDGQPSGQDKRAAS
jgi:hypothetical protein